MSSDETRPLTCLQGRLNLVDYRPQTRNIPTLHDAVLARTRNSIRHSPNNNDLLEYLGDRCVNLVIALFVDKVRLNRNHHMVVRRVLCNNDTFGRLAFYLRLDQHAKLDSQDARELDEWNPQSSHHPPKALADLFESYAGAVYTQYGWKKLEQWLRPLFDPIIKAATKDFWDKDLFNDAGSRRMASGRKLESSVQSKFLDYLEYKRDFLLDKISQAVDTLPASTQFAFAADSSLEEPHCNEIEIAIQLLNMWVCKVFITIWPEYHRATSKASHLASGITGLLACDISLSYLASLLSLQTRITILPTSDQEKPSDRKLMSTIRGSVNGSVVTYPPAILATAMKAVVGLYYRSDPETAEEWGQSWLRPLVIRAHAIVTQDPWYRPVMPTAASSASRSRAEEGDLLSSLVDGVNMMSLRSLDPLARISPIPGSQHHRSRSAHGDLSSQSSPLASTCTGSHAPLNLRVPPMLNIDSSADDAIRALVGQLHSMGIDNKRPSAHTRKPSAGNKLDEVFDRADSTTRPEGADIAVAKRLILTIKSSPGPSPPVEPLSTITPQRQDRDSQALSKWRPIGTSPNPLHDCSTPSHEPTSISSDGHSSPAATSGGIDSPLSVLDRSTDSSGEVPDSGYASSVSVAERNPSRLSPLPDLKSSLESPPSAPMFIPRQLALRSHLARKTPSVGRNPLL